MVMSDNPYCLLNFIDLRVILREFEILTFKITLGTKNLEHVPTDEKNRRQI